MRFETYIYDIKEKGECSKIHSPLVILEQSNRIRFHDVLRGLLRGWH